MLRRVYNTQLHCDCFITFQGEWYSEYRKWDSSEYRKWDDFKGLLTAFDLLHRSLPIEKDH